VLFKFFKLTDSGWLNPRFEKELSYTKSKSQAAKQSAEARWQKDANAMRTQCERNAISDNQTTKLNNQQQEPLADWIPLGLWRDYTAMRERLKRPLTPGAIDILIQDLDKLRRAGEDVSEVLRQAISGGWFAFRAIRKEKQNGKSESFQDQRSRKSAAAIENVLGRFEKTPSDIRGTLPPTDK